MMPFLNEFKFSVIYTDHKKLLINNGVLFQYLLKKYFSFQASSFSIFCDESTAVTTNSTSLQQYTNKTGFATGKSGFTSTASSTFTALNKENLHSKDVKV